VPNLPERKSRDETVRKTTRPFTAMALNGLSLGLSWKDMRHIKYTHMMQFLFEYEDMHIADSDQIEQVRDATPRDVKALMML
jgi:hypothetical protein